MKCRQCNQDFIPHYSLAELISFQPLYDNHLCPQCLSQFQLIQKDESCPYCSGPMPCQECQTWQEQYALLHHSLYHYNAIAKEWLNRYKIIGDYALKDSFSKVLYRELHYFVKKGWVLIPIPLDDYKFQKRGFNQVSALLEASHLPYNDTLLYKFPLAQAQGLKNRQERLATPQPFYIKTSPQQRYNKVMIIDDIYTTGRTMTHAYACLAPYCQKICSFSLFR